MAPEIETKLTDYQAVLLARVFRKLVEKQVNANRWKKALQQCSDRLEFGWTRLAVEYGRTLKGKAGEAVMLLTETREAKYVVGGKMTRRTWTRSGVWHHFFPKGVTCAEILKGECGVVSDLMVPRFLMVPQKYRSRRNHSANYLGDASELNAQIQKLFASNPPRPGYQRVSHRLAAFRNNSLTECPSSDKEPHRGLH